MPNTLAGLPTIKGLGAGSVTYTGITVTLKPVSADLTHNFDMGELKDGNDDVVTASASNPTEEYQLECFVTGPDVAAAKTLVKPTPLQVITLANLPYTESNGTFNYIGGFSVKQSGDFAKISMKVKRFAGAALAVL